jgi:hypothetical protein
VGGEHTDKEGGFPHGHFPEAVDENDGVTRMLGRKFGEMAGEYASGHGLVSFVIQGGKGHLAFEFPDNALKFDTGADFARGKGERRNNDGGASEEGYRSS